MPPAAHTARMLKHGVQTQTLPPKEPLSNKATHTAAPDPSPCASQLRVGEGGCGGRRLVREEPGEDDGGGWAQQGPGCLKLVL